MPIIVIEGPDFSGKTTLANSLEPHLLDVVRLRDPGSSPVAEKVRRAMQGTPMDVLARQLFMHACRLDMVGHHHIEEDPYVLWLIDRWVPSTLVYGNVDGVPLYKLVNLTHREFPVPHADLTLVLLPPWMTIVQRMELRGKLDELEGSHERLVRIHSRYLELHNQGFFENSVLLDEDDCLESALAEIRHNSVLTNFLR